MSAISFLNFSIAFFVIILSANELYLVNLDISSRLLYCHSVYLVNF